MANNVLRGLDAGLARASRQLKRVTRTYVRGDAHTWRGLDPVPHSTGPGRPSRARVDS